MLEIIVRNNIVPSARSAELYAIIYQNQLIYRTDIENNTTFYKKANPNLIRLAFYFMCFRQNKSLVRDAVSSIA